MTDKVHVLGRKNAVYSARRESSRPLEKGQARQIWKEEITDLMGEQDLSEEDANILRDGNLG
jgi:hypothetical protein